MQAFTGKLPVAQQSGARRLGLLLAMGMRIALLLAITWVMGLTHLGDPREARRRLARRQRGAALRLLRRDPRSDQILLLEVVFSLDSVITAVGMARRIEVMVAAVVIAVVVMMVFADPIARFIDRRPTLEMLDFSLFVEMLNLRARRGGAEPVQLHQRYGGVA